MDLGQDKIVSELISRLEAAPGEGVVKVEGTWGRLPICLVSTGWSSALILFVLGAVLNANKGV
jgi:hypothetical protein